MADGAEMTLRHLLDPRPEAEAAAHPIQAAVNIPFSELPQRTHELPPRAERIHIAAPLPGAAEAITWLTRRRRHVVEERGWHHSVAPVENSVGRLWRPNAFLAEIAGQLPPGRALDLACGSGRDAVYLAALGWHVTGVDHLPDALERARDLARRYSAAIEPVEWLQADLKRASPPWESCFDLIVGVRFLHRPLFQRLRDWLRPAGHVVWEAFSTLHRERHGKPASVELVLRAAEFEDLLPGFELRHVSEAWQGASHVARVWAVRR